MHDTLAGMVHNFRQAVRFFLTGTAEPSSQPDQPDRRPQAPFSPYMLLAVGFIEGLLLCAVFSLSWKYFGDIYFSQYSRLRLVPVVMTITCLSIFELRQLTGLADMAANLYDKQSPPADPYSRDQMIRLVIWTGVVAICLSLLIKFAALLAMPHHASWWPSDWRRHFNFAYPAVHLRVLILLALWGKAGILIAAATGCDGQGLSSTGAALRASMGVQQLAKSLLPVFILTGVYFSSWHNHAVGVLVGVVIFAVVYIGSMTLSWVARGHRDSSMLACGELAQLILLLSYLAISKLL